MPGWLTSKETSCQFVQSTCIKLKESAQQAPTYYGRVTHTNNFSGWEEGKKNIEKSKNEQNFCYCIWKWQAWPGRTKGGVARGGELPLPTPMPMPMPSPCMRLHSQCSACPFASFLLVCPWCPVCCPIFRIFFFFFFAPTLLYCFSVCRFCSGNGNWMVEFRKMQFESTLETRDETVGAERQQQQQVEQQ